MKLCKFERNQFHVQNNIFSNMFGNTNKSTNLFSMFRLVRFSDRRKIEYTPSSYWSTWWPWSQKVMVRIPTNFTAECPLALYKGMPSLKYPAHLVWFLSAEDSQRYLPLLHKICTINLSCHLWYLISCQYRLIINWISYRAIII